MLRENCRVGMKVVCGRPNGEKTVGEVVEVHEKKADVRTLESRGDGNRGSEEHRTKKQPAGTVWSFTFDLIEPLDGRLQESLYSLPPEHENLLNYLERGSEELSVTNSKCEVDILNAIFAAYEERRKLASLMAKYRARRTEEARMEADSLERLRENQNRRLKLLFLALGRPVSEGVSRAWHSREAHKSQRRVVLAIVGEFKEAREKMHAWSVLGSMLGGNFELSVKRLANFLKNGSLAATVANPLAFGKGEEVSGTVLSKGADSTIVALPKGEVGEFTHADIAEEITSRRDAVDRRPAGQIPPGSVSTIQDRPPNDQKKSIRDFKFPTPRPLAWLRTSAATTPDNPGGTKAPA